MNAKLLIPLLSFFAVLTVKNTAEAQMYQWKDTQGKTIISDTPPPLPKDKIRQLPGATDRMPPADKAAPKTYQQEALEFRQRQDAKREAEEKAAEAERKDKETQENCRRSRQQLFVLNSGQRISVTNENGQRSVMEDAERQREITRTQEWLNKNCS